MHADLQPADLPPLAGDDAATLWRAYHGGAGDAARGALVAHYLEFARMMAARLYARRTYPELEFADYLQFARLGLLEAIDRYDAGRGARFETFAALRINGAILDGIRSYSDMQEQIAARKRIVGQRLDVLQADDEAPRAVPDGRDADALFGYLAELAVGLAVGFALDGSGMVQSEEREYADNTYAGVELRQLRDRLLAALDSLPERQRLVLRYHYLQQVPFEQVAAMLALSKGRVAQLHREALACLRQRLRGDDALDYSF